MFIIFTLTSFFLGGILRFSINGVPTQNYSPFIKKMYRKIAPEVMSEVKVRPQRELQEVHPWYDKIFEKSQLQLFQKNCHTKKSAVVLYFL